MRLGLLISFASWSACASSSVPPEAGAPRGEIEAVAAETAVGQAIHYAVPESFVPIGEGADRVHHGLLGRANISSAVLDEGLYHATRIFRARSQARARFGYEILAREVAEIDGFPALLVKLAHRKRRKLIAMFGDDEATAVITCNYLPSVEDEAYPALRAMVLAATWDRLARTASPAVADDGLTRDHQRLFRDVSGRLPEGFQRHAQGRAFGRLDLRMELVWFDYTGADGHAHASFFQYPDEDAPYRVDGVEELEMLGHQGALISGTITDAGGDAFRWYYFVYGVQPYVDALAIIEADAPVYDRVLLVASLMTLRADSVPPLDPAAAKAAPTIYGGRLDLGDPRSTTLYVDQHGGLRDVRDRTVAERRVERWLDRSVRSGTHTLTIKYDPRAPEELINRLERMATAAGLTVTRALDPYVVPVTVHGVDGVEIGGTIYRGRDVVAQLRRLREPAGHRVLRYESAKGATKAHVRRLYSAARRAGWHRRGAP